MIEKDISLTQLIKLSYELWEKNKEYWSPMTPEYGKDFILYMIEEIGEAIQILKKKSIKEIMEDKYIREKFIEELSDILMYFIDVLNRFNISSQEFSEVYLTKYRKNLQRNYHAEYKKYLLE